MKLNYCSSFPMSVWTCLRCFFLLGASLFILLGAVGCGRSSDPAELDSSATESPRTKASAGDRNYVYGKKIDFSQAGDAARYQVSGWSHPESDGVWTEGGMARLEFAVPASDSDIIFKATVSGFVKPPELASQGVDVFINGQEVAHWEIAIKGLAQMKIPATYLKDGKLQLDFKLPNAASPASLRLSVDERRLGIRFYDLELTKP